MQRGSCTSVGPYTDEQLMEMLSGATDRVVSEEAFAEVFARYQHRVVTWCYRVTRDHEAATDLAQEVFLKAYRYRESFRGESRLSTWLFSITRNHCLSAIKRRNDEVVPLDPVLHRALRDEAGPQPEQDAVRTELYRRMMGLMRRTLEPIEVRVMTLHYGHEVPLSDITRLLALTNPSGAKAHIVNARRKLSGIARRRGWDVALAERRPQPDFWQTEAAA